MRTGVVVLASVFVIGLTLPNAWVPSGKLLPFTTDSSFTIASLAPDRIAANSGLRAGDRIDPESLDFSDRIALFERYMIAGHPLAFDLHHGDRIAHVQIPSVTETSGFAYTLLKRLTATLFIIVAAVLLIRRPSVMLWGFFLYALGSADAAPYILGLASPQAMAMGTVFLEGPVYSVIGPLGLLLFATRFPAEPTGGFRRTLSRLTPALAILLLLQPLGMVLFGLGVSMPPMLGNALYGVSAFVLTLGIVSLVAGMTELDPVLRQRLRWVLTGFGIFYLSTIYQFLGGYLPDQGWPPAWSAAGWYIGALNATVIFIPLTVAYAVIRYRVLDIRFVIGRGIVYAVITSIAVAIFTLVDWVAHDIIAQSGLALTAEMLAAVAVGFWLNALHGRAERLVDAVVFRARHLAEQRLVRVASGLPHAHDLQSVAALTVHEPIAAFNLYSGAFFRRSQGDSYRAVHVEGLSAMADVRLDQRDPLLVHLYGERGPVLLHQIQWTLPGSDAGAEGPVVALPVFVRQELEAVALYGGHRTGEAIDPDEMRLLNALCVSASAALDHLEAESLRQQVEDLRSQLSAFKLAGSVEHA